MVLASSVKDEHANTFGVRFDIRDRHHDEVMLHYFGVSQDPLL